MSSRSRNRIPPLLALLLAGCASVPKGPDVAVMPGPGKTFEQFQQDDVICRDFADKSTGGPNSSQQTENVAKGAAAGTAMGAAAGALLGGGRGGSVMGGAGVGLLLGSMIGAGNAGAAGDTIQHRYDIAYEQCMAAKGNHIPGSPRVTYYNYRNQRPVVIYEPPPGGPPPPPPP